ncbi:hypothetical protein HDG40_008010, partial [Paraburkholderia sp. JPY158]
AHRAVPDRRQAQLRVDQSARGITHSNFKRATLRNDATAIKDMKSINVDKDNFNEVLKWQKLPLALVVPNHLGLRCKRSTALGV